jgi:plastocyanin
MNRTLGWTAGLALAGAVALTGATVANGQAATPHQAAPGHSATSTSRTGPVIKIHDYGFHTPSSVTRGATVTVRNKDATTHSVTSNSGLFGVTIPAHSTRTFKAPGSAGAYHFHCKFHSEMHGVLHVH